MYVFLLFFQVISFNCNSDDNVWIFLLFLSRSQQKTIINAMAVNEEGVMATGGTFETFSCGN